MSRSRAGVIALCLLGLCWAAVMIPSGANQTAHFATVHALANGSVNIDRERRWTGDTAYSRGHFFAAKSPGLALATTPYFLAVDAIGLVPALPSPKVPFPEAQKGISASALWEAAAVIISPITEDDALSISNLAPGAVVPMPTLPLLATFIKTAGVLLCT